MSKSNHSALIIGAGPAGLTAGIELLKTKKFKVSILEREKIIGGLARTTDYKGYKFDIGPHHFITEAPHIEKWWKDLMGDDFITLKRFTRIYYKKHYFKYPLEALNVITGLNILECTLCCLSYIWARIRPIKNVKSFQDWIRNKFGYRLFSIFFKTYTEKVWGINCTKISSDWAAQRIKGFDLSKAIFYSIVGKWYKKNAPRTLSDTFYYPPFGAGQLWEKVADKIRNNNLGKIETDQEVISIEHNGNQILSINSRSNEISDKEVKKNIIKYTADYFLSTMSLKSLILSMSPLPDATVIEAAKSLGYRGLITINLVVSKKNMFPDHWLYIHEKEVKLGRIGNMNNFSIKMSANPEHTALSLEYFTFINEDFWNKTEAELIEIGKMELEKIGIVESKYIIDGMVMKTAEAYPLYDENYKTHLKIVLDYLNKFSNLFLMGRNGLHRYNNMDLAMISAMDAVEKVLKKVDDKNKDIKVNIEKIERQEIA